jgi:hypothetical protein
LADGGAGLLWAQGLARSRASWPRSAGRCGLAAHASRRRNCSGCRRTSWRSGRSRRRTRGWSCGLRGCCWWCRRRLIYLCCRRCWSCWHHTRNSGAGRSSNTGRSGSRTSGCGSGRACGPNPGHGRLGGGRRWRRNCCRLRRGLRLRGLRRFCGCFGSSELLEVRAHLHSVIHVDRARVRFLLGDADFRKIVDQHLGLDFELSGQFVDSYLIWVRHSLLFSVSRLLRRTFSLGFFRCFQTFRRGFAFAGFLRCGLGRGAICGSLRFGGRLLGGFCRSFRA